MNKAIINDPENGEYPDHEHVWYDGETYGPCRLCGFPLPNLSKVGEEMAFKDQPITNAVPLPHKPSVTSDKPEWEKELWDSDSWGELIGKVCSILSSHRTKDREELVREIEALKRKCHGEFGCGWDGTGKDQSVTCGSGFNHHSFVRDYNHALQSIIELIKKR